MGESLRILAVTLALIPLFATEIAAWAACELQSASAVRDASSRTACADVIADASAGGPGLLFYESFDNLSSVQQNNGTLTGSPDFVPGVLGGAANLTGSRKVCYPLQNNFNPTNGTVEFWLRPPSDNYHGFFDIGGLMNPNSWGIFKNANYAIMEVKNNVNSFDQAWSPNEFPADGRWHHIAGAWERKNVTTYFKVCVDARCKRDYDGITPNSYPALTGNFCVGWALWYGYSASIFDEFTIADYAKSDQEILADYLALAPERNLTPQPCRMFKPRSTGAVQMNCSGLYVNGQPYTVKGVGYQPMPIGRTAEIPADMQAMYDDPRIWERDFPLLSAMNANTVKTWGEVRNATFLDAAYQRGIRVVMGFWINCGEDYSNPAVRQNYINKFTQYVQAYKDHPAVLAWALGNENNLAYCSNAVYVDDFYSLGNELARVAYQLEGPSYHPVGIVNGDLGLLGIPEFNSADASLNYTDFWGINVYPGETFGNWFTEYAALSGKPLLATEYGIDALNNSASAEYHDVHAAWVAKQWREIRAANRTLGATLMAYSDEWWKAGSPWTHDNGGYPTDRHPDGYSNEEWWGLVSVEDNGTAPDIVHPRLAYFALQDEFAPVRCNDTITSDTLLTNDLAFCPENGLILGAHNIMLDCGGHAIRGSGAGIGIGTGAYDGVAIRNCTVTGFETGIFAASSTESRLAGNTVANNTHGIRVNGGSHNTIVGNNLSHNDDGIYLWGTSDNIVNGNIAEGNINGALAYGSPSNDLAGNVFANNTGYGATLFASEHNRVWNNAFSGNGATALESNGSNNNSWNASDSGNRWDDFEGNPGYPTHYVIDGPGDGIDYSPFGAKWLDLEALEFMKVSPASPHPGDEIMFYYQIFNHGEVDADQLLFRVDTDSSVPDIVNSAPLNVTKNSSYFGFVHWSYPAAGAYSPAFHIDDGNAYVETEEADNQRATAVTVTPILKPQPSSSPVFRKPQVVA